MRAAIRPIGLLAAVICVLIGLSAGAPAFSADQPAFKLAVVDIRQIMRVSKAAKAVRAEVEKQQKAFQSDVAQQEKSLRDAEQQLASQRATLPPAEVDKKRQDLEKQVAQARKNLQARKDQIDKLYGSGVDQVSNAIVGVVEEIAQSQGVTLVLDKSLVVFPPNAFDITAETLKRLDAKLPTVKLK